MDLREALIPHGVFQLTGLTGPFVKRVWMSHPHEKKMGYDYPLNMALKSLPMGEESFAWLYQWFPVLLTMNTLKACM